MPPEKGLLCLGKKDENPFSVGIVIPTMPGYSTLICRDTHPEGGGIRIPASSPYLSFFLPVSFHPRSLSRVLLVPLYWYNKSARPKDHQQH